MKKFNLFKKEFAVRVVNNSEKSFVIFIPIISFALDKGRNEIDGILAFWTRNYTLEIKW